MEESVTSLPSIEDGLELSTKTSQIFLDTDEKSVSRFEHLKEKNIELKKIRGIKKTHSSKTKTKKTRKPIRRKDHGKRRRLGGLGEADRPRGWRRRAKSGLVLYDPRRQLRVRGLVTRL